MEQNLSIGLEVGHTQITSIGLRHQVRTYPSHSSILYTRDLKHTGREYQTIWTGGNGFRHLLQYVGTAYVSGQIGVVKSKMLEQSGVDQNNGNKNRKRCNIIASMIHCCIGPVVRYICLGLL
jgi:hypothetical protein